MRVDRSFAFLDLCHFTAFTERAGDEESMNVLAVFRRIVREVASAFAVRVDKWLGDGVMLVSVEAAPLVEAVLEIEERCAEELPLALRSGITRGDVLLLEGDDYIGGAVNLAAKLCNEAAAHEILVTEEIAHSAPVSASYLPVGERRPAGFPRSVPLLSVRRFASRRGAPARLDG